MFKNLYYIVPISNLVGIFKYGKIFSRNKAIERGLIVEDPSNKEVQEKREFIVILGNIENGEIWSLHDFVNLYINPRNAMLYFYLKKKKKIVILEFSGDILNKLKNIYFSFKNASTDDSKISKTPDLIEQNISKVFSLNWDKNKEIKKIMQSEVLVLDYVPIDFLENIIVPSEYMNEVKNIIKKFNLKIPVVSRSKNIPDIFFEQKF